MECCLRKALKLAMLSFQGFIHLWDVSYILKQKKKHHRKTTMQHLRDPSSIALKKKEFSVQNLNSKQAIPKVSRQDKPWYDNIAGFNALRRQHSKIDPHSAKYFQDQAKQNAAALEENYAQYPVVNALESIELKFW